MNKMLLPLAAAIVAGCATSECAKSSCGCAPCKCSPCACAAAPNTLTCAEKAEGWKLLWDGKTTDGWVGERFNLERFPDKGWEIKDGVLTVLPRARINAQGKWEKLPADQCRGGGGDIVTVKDYQDFAFKFDFKLTKAANSGVKYFYNKGEFGGTCEEYQVLDPAHPDYDKPNPSGVANTHRLSALYDLKATDNAEKYVRPLGEWNTGMIVSKGCHVEHWLNGVKVLEYDRGSADFRKLVAGSKYVKGLKEGQHWGEAKKGRIKLQDHSDSTVSYRNLKIKEL